MPGIDGFGIADRVTATHASILTGSGDFQVAQLRDTQTTAAWKPPLPVKRFAPRPATVGHSIFVKIISNGS